MLPLRLNFLTSVNLQKSKIFIRPAYLKRRLIGFFAIMALLFFQNCKKGPKIPDEIKDIPVYLKVDRFDEKFAAAATATLPKLMAEYPLMFPKQYDSLFWQKKLKDTLQSELNQETEKAFPDFEAERQDLETLFKHIEYYYPKTPLPKIMTVTSDVDYRNQGDT